MNEYLDPLLHKAEKENKLVVLMGDLNINLLEADSCADVSNFLDLLGSYCLLPNIILPTRLTSTSNTLIDNIFSSAELCSSLSGNIITCISDHLAQFAFLNHEPSTAPPTGPQIKRDWSKFDSDKFLFYVRNAPWDIILETEHKDPNLSLNKLLEYIEKLLNQLVPFK